LYNKEAARRVGERIQKSAQYNIIYKRTRRETQKDAIKNFPLLFSAGVARQECCLSFIKVAPFAPMMHFYQICRSNILQKAFPFLFDKFLVVKHTFLDVSWHAEKHWTERLELWKETFAIERNPFS
jgi:hypothetical protein